ncbi:GNAT family N-acetyltransferase [Acidobacteria bacterium ACD]|nr:MAG: GNAT family N-acetyltransferase [Acidobacteriota bacterium]MCE7956867.1 GNAT family N-acetyltransferase [Acidobacteria bacterium ACB2]MDL1949312.1 GNAT family N-acetyltransferase [Acidobacteria bacterium ACD]
MTPGAAGFLVRQTLPEDFPGIVELSKRVYPFGPPWSVEQLSSHHCVFPEGQFVAVAHGTAHVVGMAASLVVFWDDYDLTASWRDFTGAGLFTNHDPDRGRTLYGAEVMADPELRGRGIATLLYGARRRLVEERRLLRIRAGARLRGYHLHADLGPEEYAARVVRGELVDPTLTFQLHRGFHVLAIVPSYLRQDPESLGYAAVIEWINRRVARPEDFPERVIGGAPPGP